MHPSSLVIPIKSNTNVTCAFPLCCDGVIFFQCVLQMLCMFFSHILYPKVIHYQCELHRPPFVFPKSWYQFALVISSLVEPFSRSSLASNPDCGRPYIPRLATMCTDPFGIAVSLKLYSKMISSGMSMMFIQMYSGRLSGVMR